MRTLSTTLTNATNSSNTTPVFLLRMSFKSETLACTWDTLIQWNDEDWIASGIEVTNIDSRGATLEFPTGEADPWLGIMLNEGTRGKGIKIYEHHTDTGSSPQTDAALILTGVMDEMSITDKIRLRVIEKSTARGFPITPIDAPTFNFLPNPGDRIVWGRDEIVAG